jgi:hypothetical protein
MDLSRTQLIQDTSRMMAVKLLARSTELSVNKVYTGVRRPVTDRIRNVFTGQVVFLGDGLDEAEEEVKT